MNTQGEAPAGSVFRYQGRVLRVVNQVGVAGLEAFLAAPSGQKLMAAGAVVPTRRAAGTWDSTTVLFTGDLPMDVPRGEITDPATAWLDRNRARSLGR